MNRAPSRAATRVLHSPDIHAIVLGAAFCILTLVTIVRLLLRGTSGQALQDDFRGSFQVRTLQVPQGEERAAPDDADDLQRWSSHCTTKYVNVTV